ncbi:DUF3149 domain-containing protein [Undibacterium crateris]|nr:DUF3149 domain-containing protein [Undibacterium crateris]
MIDLFSTDYGLMSLGVILFVLFMGVFFFSMFKKHVQEEMRANK